MRETHGESQLVPSVLQFVVAGVESEGLHDIGPGPQELPVQLTDWRDKHRHSDQTDQEHADRSNRSSAVRSD